MGYVKVQQHYDKHLVGTYAYVGAHPTLSGRRGVGLTISPAWHQTREKCELLLTGIIPQTRLQVWNSTRWLCPFDPAFQDILGSKDVDAAVIQLETARKKVPSRVHSGSDRQRQSGGNVSSGIIRRARSQSDVITLGKHDDIQTRTPSSSRQASVRFSRSLRKAESRRNLRDEALAWKLNNDNHS